MAPRLRCTRLFVKVLGEDAAFIILPRVRRNVACVGKQSHRNVLLPLPRLD